MLWSFGATATPDGENGWLRSARFRGADADDAEQDARVVGFVHVEFDNDPRRGSLVDNLHVTHDLRRTGIGTRLLHRAARAVAGHESSDAMYLWVLRQNTAAQRFYRSCGAFDEETALVSPPGGDPARLQGAPRKLRMAWPDVARLLLVGHQ
jgi:GNAT superfamily N-acetyltransferase